MNHCRQAVLRSLDAIERSLRRPIALPALARHAGIYTCFTHRDPVTRIGKTINCVFGTWLPRSRFVHGDSPNLDRQDERFGDGGPDCEFDFLIPVKPKPAGSRTGIRPVRGESPSRPQPWQRLKIGQPPRFIRRYPASFASSPAFTAGHSVSVMLNIAVSRW